MKILKLVLIGILALILLGLLVGALMPSQWSVERSLVISAGPEKIHAHVGRLESWPRWMPWMEDDPAMKLAWQGEDGAAGSRMSWTSEEMGNGRLTLTSADPATGITYELMLDHFHQPAKGSIAYAPEAGGTRVTWKDTGDVGGNPFVKLFRPLLEAWLAQYFDKGLANVERLAEAGG